MDGAHKRRGEVGRPRSASAGQAHGALAFLILIGVMLVAESLGQHLNKGYIYFAMAFGVGVEAVNMKLRGKGHPPAKPAA